MSRELGGRMSFNQGKKAEAGILLFSFNTVRSQRIIHGTSSK